MYFFRFFTRFSFSSVKRLTVFLVARKKKHFFRSELFLIFLRFPLTQCFLVNNLCLLLFFLICENGSIKDFCHSMFLLSHFLVFFFNFDDFQRRRQGRVVGTHSSLRPFRCDFLLFVFFRYFYWNLRYFKVGRPRKLQYRVLPN